MFHSNFTGQKTETPTQKGNNVAKVWNSRPVLPPVIAGGSANPAPS